MVFCLHIAIPECPCTYYNTFITLPGIGTMHCANPDRRRCIDGKCHCVADPDAPWFLCCFFVRGWAVLFKTIKPWRHHTCFSYILHRHFELMIRHHLPFLTITPSPPKKTLISRETQLSLGPPLEKKFKILTWEYHLTLINMN